MIHDHIKLKQLMEYRMEKKLNKQIKTKTFKRNQTSIAYEILCNHGTSCFIFECMKMSRSRFRCQGPNLK